MTPGHLGPMGGRATRTPDLVRISWEHNAAFQPYQVSLKKLMGNISGRHQMVSGSLALLYSLLGFHGGWGAGGSGPDRGRSQPSLRSSQPDLRLSQPCPRLSQLGLSPSQPGLMDSQQGLRVDRKQMDGRRDRQADESMGRRMGGWMDGKMDQLTNGQTDRQTDR